MVPVLVQEVQEALQTAPTGISRQLNVREWKVLLRIGWEHPALCQVHHHRDLDQHLQEWPALAVVDQRVTTEAQQMEEFDRRITTVRLEAPRHAVADFRVQTR